MRKMKKIQIPIMRKMKKIQIPRVLYNRSLRVIRLEDNVVVCESEPHIRTIVIHHLESRSQKRYSIALPYVVYIYTPRRIGDVSNRMFMGFRNSPISTKSNDLAYPLLPNVNESFDVCLSSALIPTERAIAAGDYTEAVGCFWTYKFEQYFNGRWAGPVLLCDTVLRSYAKWQELTETKKLDFFTTIKWPDVRPFEYVVGRKFKKKRR
jgi:hypothetical protein